jgi:hypothetical protein
MLGFLRADVNIGAETSLLRLSWLLDRIWV